MANQTTKVRGTGTATRRTLTAAARAAAKRSARSEREVAEGREERHSSRTLLIERPDGWDDPPEPSAEEEPEQPTPGPVRGRRLLTAALCVVLVAGLVAVAVLGWQYREGRRTDQARGQVLTAAEKAAPAVLSYDYRHLDQDFARARGYLTGGFRDQYLKTTKTVVGPTAAKYHGVVRATVAAASVVSAAPDKAVVLLFVNQTTQSTQVPGSRLDLNRVRMTLTRTSTGWKVSAVDAL
ncbi:hypothetical protein ACFYZE_32860 [Streptomyces sp. NPDC001796]|uniref:hypothetical protein n=1 Tax=Streptomyces sp. NPDC001796 TaxID=3364609 RepID=UPI0036B96E06